jgi:hypothetical protein
MENLYINRPKNFNKSLQELTLYSTQKINHAKKNQDIPKRKPEVKNEQNKRKMSSSVSETSEQLEFNSKVEKKKPQQNKKNKLKFA